VTYLYTQAERARPLPNKRKKGKPILEEKNKIPSKRYFEAKTLT
jgi:hypothetical protein